MLRYSFEHYMETTRLSGFYGIRDKYPGTLRLEMGTLEAGIYMVKISLDGKYLSSRRIIKR